MTRRGLWLLSLLLLAAPLSAQERPIAVSTLTTTDTSSASACIGCAVGATAATGTVRAGTLTLLVAQAHVLATGGINGTQNVAVVNTTSGTAARAGYRADAGTNDFLLDAFSQGFTTSGFNIASSTKLESQGAGGLNLVTSHASGVIGLWTNSLLRFGVNAAGDLTFGASSHIMDSNGTPGIASGFGTSPTISGTDYAFAVTYGSGAGDVGGVVQFGHTFNTAPVCVAIQDGVTISSSDETTTTVTLTVASSTYTGKRVKVHCRGY